MEEKKLNRNQQKDEQLSKEIADLGLTSQNQYLVENGFLRLKRNLKALLRNEKDQVKALATLKEKQDRKKHGKKEHGSEKYDWRKHTKEGKQERDNKCLEEIQKANFTEQNTFLVSKGFTNPKKNLKKLQKFQGDKDKALEALMKHAEKHGGKRISKEEKEKNSLEEIEKLGYSAQHKALVAKGFLSAKRNLKTLTKTSGDVDKALSKIAKKEEKRELRNKLKAEMSPEQKSKLKLEREEKRKFKDSFLTRALTEVKPNTKTVYLDGNNMLFVDDKIRKLCLKSKGKVAEKLIADLAIECGKSLGLEKVVLVFDMTKNVWDKDFGSLKFSVCSASPNFKTSDDALVEWMDGKSALENVLVVTSDVGLQMRLEQKGVKMIMKSGAWFKVLKQKLGQETYNKIVANGEQVELNDVTLSGLTLNEK